VFHDWDQPGGAASLYAFRADILTSVFHFTGAAPSYWAGHFVREDLNFDGIVDVFDAVLLAGAAGATPENPRWNYGQADITADYIVDVFDAVRLAGHAGWITLPS
jgi:hypothetical protein